MPIVTFNGKTPQIAPTAYVADSAILIGDVQVGDRTVIYPHCIIRGDLKPITIGANNIILEGCMINTTVMTPSKIGDNCMLGFGAVIHGSTIGNRCVIAIRSVLMPFVVVEDEAIIGANAYVPQGMKIPKRKMAMGTPAEVKKDVLDKDMQMWDMGKEQWRKLAFKYKEEGLKV
jgi:carbonic anhydrase/acetyltransferase-like protein (isoleucine patch superfamily)